MPLTAMDLGVGASNNSPVLLADPTEPRFVVLANRIDFPEFSCALQISGDGGRGWAPANPVPTLPAGAETCYGPEVAFDRQGTLYYLFVGLAGAGNRPMGAFLTTSTDRGRSFSPPRHILGPLNFAVRMAIDLTAGPKGRLHLVWINSTSDPALGAFGPPPNPILAAHSDDGGVTFSDPVEISDAARSRVVAPALSLGPRGTVHVVYYDLGDDARDYQNLEGPTWDGPWSLVMTTSTDGGSRFSPGQVVDDSVAPAERVMLIFTMPPPAIVSDRRGLVCVAWSDARHGDADVLLRCSGNGGRAWHPSRRLNDDAVGNGVRQYLPRLGLSPGGRLDAIFFDRRADPLNAHNDVWYTFSRDGGVHFSPNVKLTSLSSDSRIGPQYAGVGAEGQFELGSRLGLLSRRGDVIAAWPDTRNTRPQGTEQDVVAIDVTLASAGGPSGWARWAGGAMIVMAAAAGALGLRARRPQTGRA